MLLLVFYLRLQSDFSCFVVVAAGLYVLEMYSYSYIIFLFYISETYSLMMAALVQLKQVAI
jgi:hypothetical protein